MSLNQIYDRPRTYNHPVKFKNIKLGQEQLNNIIFDTNKADIEYNEDLVGNYYMSLKNGNSELYSYTDNPYTIDERDISSLFSSSNIVQVTTGQEFINAISGANDFDRIQIMNDISVSGSINILKSYEIFAAEGEEFTLLLDNAIYIHSSYNYFNNVVISTPFLGASHLINILEGIGTPIDIVFRNCVFGMAIGFLRNEADSNVYIYDCSFYHLGVQQEIKRLINVDKATKKVLHMNRCNIYGDGVAGDTKTDVISLNNDNGRNMELDIIIENSTLGSLNLSPNTAIKSLIKTWYPCNNLNIYLNSNEINTIEQVVEIKNNEFLGGIGNMQAYNNTVRMSDGKGSNFAGLFYTLPASGNFTYINNKDARIRAYKNVLPDSTKENPIPSSAYDNALLTSEYGITPTYEFRKINALYIQTISIDSEVGVGYVYNPLTENIIGSNKDILGVNKIQTAIIQANGTQINFTSDTFNNSNTALNTVSASGDGTIHFTDQLDMETNDIVGIGNLECALLDSQTTNILIDADLKPTANSLYALGKSDRLFVDVFTSKIHASTIVSNGEPQVYIERDLIPNVGGVKLGSTTDPFPETYTSKILTNEIAPVSGVNTTVSSHLIPVNASINIGTPQDYYNNVSTNIIQCDYIDGTTSSNVILQANLNPDITNIRDLGTTTNYYREVFSTSVRTDVIDGLASTNIELQGNLIPDNNASRTLGNSTSVFSQVNTRVVNSDNTTLMMRLSNSDDYRYQFNASYLRPLGTGVVSLTDLGLSGSRWRNIYLVNQPNVSSSRVKKKNITDCHMGLDFLNRLQPVMYHHITSDDTEKKQCGLIYEDVEQVVNEMGISFGGLQKDEYDDVDPDTGETTHVIDYGIKYGEFIPILINSVKELKEENQKLIRRLEVLESKSS